MSSIHECLKLDDDAFKFFGYLKWSPYPSSHLGIVQNKIKSFENALVKPKKIQDQSIAEIFVQKITLPVKNTQVSDLESPFYNMRVAMHKI